MPGGDPFTHAERFAVEDTIRQAEQASRVEFSVFVGNAVGDARSYATQLHNTLAAPARTVLILVDPTRRILEIVTGGWVRRTLTDEQVQLAAAAMQTSFAAGDLVGGLRHGIGQLADHAQR